MSCLTARTKSPGVRSGPSTDSSGLPCAQARAAQAKPGSGSRRNDSRLSFSMSSSSRHTDMVAASTSRTGPLGCGTAAAASAERDSKVSADTHAASSAGLSPSHSPRRRHSAASRSSSA